MTERERDTQKVKETQRMRYTYVREISERERADEALS